MRKIPFHYFALAVIPLYVACAASDDSEEPGGSAGTGSTAGTAPGVSGSVGLGGSPATAGSPSTGGVPAGTAGTPAGTAGTPAGTAGTPAGTAGQGTGGTAPMGSCAAATSADGKISTFEMNVANQLTMGTDVWSASPAGSTAMAMDGKLAVKQTMGSWGSVSAVLNKGASCVNVKGKYTGIKFNLASTTNKSIKFVLVTPETKADSSHYGAVLTIPCAATPCDVPFALLQKATWGAALTLPAGYVPEEHVVGIGFGMMEEKELMDITLDDVTFY
jgi:hypothetical protein